MARVLRDEDGYRWVIRVRRLQTRERGRIQIVAEIEAHRSNGSLIPHPNADGMRNVVVVALVGRTLLQAQLRIFLPPAQQVVRHVVPVREDVAGIMENSEANIVLKVWKSSGRKTQFQVIQKQRAAPTGNPDVGSRGPA